MGGNVGERRVDSEVWPTGKEKREAVRLVPPSVTFNYQDEAGRTGLRRRLSISPNVLKKILLKLSPA